MKNLMKFGLLVPCIAFVASCNNQTKYRAYRSEEYVEFSHEGTGPAYYAMEYAIIKTGGKDRKLTTDNFYAMNGDTRINFVCFLTGVNTTKTTYKSTTKEVTASSIEFGNVYAAFAKEPYKNCKYYFGGVEIPVDGTADPVEVIIK